MQLIDARDAIEMLFGSPITALSDCSRGFLIPEVGHDFIDADWANIEGRILAWLAGEEWKIRAFRNFDAGTGPDLYELSYSVNFGIPIEQVTSEQRQIGKVSELSLGFQGGKAAFQNMAKNYGVKVSDVLAEKIKVAWRMKHPLVVKFWYDLERSAIAAIRNPGEKIRTGKITYFKTGSFLLCRLPSGRAISYPYPSIEEVDTPWNEKKLSMKYMGVDADTKKWGKQTAYGGLLAENVTQATARDILVWGMLRLEEAGYPIVLHVHDEILCEVPKGFGSVEEVCKILEFVPDWATGLPLKVEGWRGERYRK